MKFTLRILLSLTLLFAVASCSHRHAINEYRAAPNARMPLIPDGVFSYKPYGGADAIVVMLIGNVEHGGEYRLKKDSSLYDLLICAGGYGGKGDFGGTPSRFLYLTRSGSPDQKIAHHGMPKESLLAIRLQDSDVIFVPEILF